MELIRTEIPEVLLVRGPVHSDERGTVQFVWTAPQGRDAGLPTVFHLENHITSRRWVLRGIHRQMTVPQGKLVRGLVGRVFDVAVDLRPGSPSFGRWVGRELEGGRGEALWVPPGFGHGMLALTEGATISIQASAPALAGDERTLAWDDPVVGVSWPLPAGLAPVLSPRDSRGEAVEAFRG
jgi:dTDP-4-dehydrorhamnose 3,5-epimerase